MSHDAGGAAALQAFMAELALEFPRFRTVEKNASALSKAIDVALKIVTLGGQRDYLTKYYTVIGDTLFLPEGWAEVDPLDAVITLRHERVHLRQRRRLTLLGMTIVYVLLPLPMGLAYGRARLEWEAYTETLRATFELKGAEALRSGKLRARIVSRFTGPDYLWMWPFRGQVERWYDDAVAAIEGAQ